MEKKSIFAARNETAFETINRVGAAARVLRHDRHRDPYDRNDDGYSDIPKLRNLSVGVNAFVRPTRLSKLSFRYNIVSDEHRGGNLTFATGALWRAFTAR